MTEFELEEPVVEAAREIARIERVPFQEALRRAVLRRLHAVLEKNKKERS